MRARLDRAREVMQRRRVEDFGPAPPDPNTWTGQVRTQEVTDEEMDAIERARDVLDAAPVTDLEERVLRFFGTPGRGLGNVRTDNLPRRVWYTWNEETQQHEVVNDPLDEEEATRDEE